MQELVHQFPVHQRRKLGLAEGQADLRLRRQQVQATAGGVDGETQVDRNKLHPLHQAQRQDGRPQVRGRLHPVPAPMRRNDERPRADATRVPVQDSVLRPLRDVQEVSAARVGQARSEVVLQGPVQGPRAERQGL